MRWYPLEPVDESFFDTAPYVHSYPVDLPVPADQVWAALTSDQSMGAWKLPVKSLTWTTPRPFGVGTEREVILTGSSFGIRERFFRWDEGKRMTFSATECSRPLLRRFAEDYVVEERPGGSRFTWTIALDPAPKARWLFRASDPLNRVAFRAVPRAARKHFS